MGRAQRAARKQRTGGKAVGGKGAAHGSPTAASAPEKPQGQPANVRSEQDESKRHAETAKPDATGPQSAKRPRPDTELASTRGENLTPSMALVAAAASGLAALPGLSDVTGDVPLVGTPSYALGSLCVAALMAWVSLWRRWPPVATLIFAGVCCFALGVVEDRTQSSAFHRTLPKPFGVGPDMITAGIWGALLAALTTTKAQRRGSAGQKLGGPLLGTLMLGFLLLVPSPVASVSTPGLWAFNDDPVDGAARLGRGLVPFLHVLMLCCAFASSLVPSFRHKLGVRGHLGLFTGWALLTALLGAEGWVRPTWHWPLPIHALVRLTTLLAVLASAYAVFQGGAAAWQQRPRATRWIIAGALSAVFLLIKVEGWHWSTTDENVYFYAADALSRGVLPYRDYFYAHPPLKVLLPGVVFALGGFSIWTAQLLPTLAALTVALCIWRFTARIAPSAYAEIAGLLAAVWFLGDERVLIASTEMSGINTSTALTWLSLWLLLRDQPRLAGASMAAALGLGMIQLWMLPVVLIVAWWRAVVSAARGSSAPDFRLGLRHLASGFGASFGLGLFLIFGAGWLLGGDDFITQVFRYHSLKPATSAGYVELEGNPLQWPPAVLGNLGLLFERGDVSVLARNSLLLWPALLGSLVVGVVLFRTRARRSDPKQHWPTLLAMCLGLPLGLVFMALLRERYDYYWVATIPVLSVVATLGCLHVAWRLRENPVGPLALIALLCLLPTRAIAAWGLMQPLSTERTAPGSVDPLTFRSSSPTPFLDELQQSLFYKPHVVRGELEAPLNRYLWAKKKSFSIPEEVAAEVNRVLPEGATVSGSSTSAPLVALLAGRRMAGDEVDTNFKVFSTQLRSDEEFWRDACADNLGAIISTGGYFTPRYLRQSATVNSQFRLAKRFEDPLATYGSPRIVELWVRSDLSRPCEYRAQ